MVTVRYAHTPWKTRFAMIPRAWGLLFIALVIMGGLYTGIFTPTEAGAIGAFAALLGSFGYPQRRLAQHQPGPL